MQDEHGSNVGTMLEAVSHHRAGRWQEAEQLYRRVLEVEPNRHDANHNLGVIAIYLGKAAIGLPYLRAALASDPANQEYWMTYTEALLSAGRIQDALAALEQARRQGIGGDRLEEIATRATRMLKMIQYNAKDIISLLSIYVPSSGGSRDIIAELAFGESHRIFQNLSIVLNSGNVKLAPDCIDANAFCCSHVSMDAAEKLRHLFNLHGSDKASTHDYYYVYGEILKDPDNVSAVLEIGLGTNNTDVPSNMGHLGRPGASLRAFRDFLKNAAIYGADVDKRILFSDERIKTFFVDQTDISSYSELGASMPCPFDLVIDDGLHSPAANIATMAFALNKLKIGGWFVVEDINKSALAVWEIASSLLPNNFRSQLIRTKAAWMFCVQRLG